MNHANTPFPGGVDTTLLERILWNQIVRLVHQAPPAWNRGSPSARVIREVLQRPTLDPDELVIVQMWEPVRETARALFDQLLQMRVNRAARDGLGVEADRLGIPRPDPPRIAVVRSGDREALGGRRTAIELLKGTQIVDIAELEPGEHLDELVDLLVLANQDASQELLSTLKVDVAFQREGQPIDLMVPQTPSVQVFDLERSLAQLEWVLRAAIPEDLRLKIDGGQSFDRDLTGELLGGKYRVKAFMGKGAFKTVYEGVDEMLGARVAIAVLNPKGARSHRALEHFQDEARVLTTLDHENIVRWITFDRTPDKLHYFVMEYLDGEELEKILRRDGRLPPKRVAQILLQVLSALRRAHALGKRGRLLHLDLKPENVFVLPSLVPGDPERVKVIDFGIGQHVGAEVRAAERPQMSSIYDLPTEELGKSIGSMLLPEDESGVPGRVQRARGGTLLYASPEQCKHLAGHRDIIELDGRSDLYSLGVMAFRMLTGQFPFAKCDSAYQAIENHLSVPPRKVGSLGIKVPRKLAAFVDKCLIKNRERRWKGANEAYAFLESFVRPKVSPTKVALPIAAIGAAGIVAVWNMNMGKPPSEPLDVLDAGPTRELWVGQDSPRGTLKLTSSAPWGRAKPPEPLLVGTPDAPDGWSVKWSDVANDVIELSAGDGASRKRVHIELKGDGVRWRTSSPLTLNLLGEWEIDAVGPRPDDSKLFDPRGRRLQMTVSSDSDACNEITSIALKLGGEVLAEEQAVIQTRDVGRTTYQGPALDPLFNYPGQTVDLVARDRAGQERKVPLTLPIAGERVNFKELGFIDTRDPERRYISASEGIHVIFPHNALLIRLNGEGTVRAEVPGALPWTGSTVDKEVQVPLEELGIREDKSDLRLEVDDARWVDRIKQESRSAELRFRFSPRVPEITTQLRKGDVVIDLIPSGSTKDPEPRYFRESGQVELNVTPSGNMILYFVSTCTRDGSSDTADNAVKKLCSTGRSAQLGHELPEDGRYRIVISGYATTASMDQGQKILEEAYLVEVDTTLPSIEALIDGENVEVRDGVRWIRGALPERARVNVVEHGKRSLLSWKLRLPDETEKNGVFGNEAEIDLLPALHSELPTTPEDGEYVLTLEARDAAGNSDKRTERWHVALRDPLVKLQEPRTKDDVWSFGSGEGWNIVVSATDPNAIESVHAQVACRGISPFECDLLHEYGDRWELPEDRRPSISPWCTGQELTIEVTATDNGGSIGKDALTAIVPEIPRSKPLRIARRERPTEIMVQVPVPPDFEYIFGGRTEEDDAASGFQRDCWNVKIHGALRATNGSALRPYFLDEREVSRGEFLEFVHAVDGYLNEDWWPSGGAGPERARRDDWKDELDEDLSRPVTRVTWAEAFAYARWRGKRLPNLVEWEFAVRGDQYSDGKSPVPEEPFDLCSGPREWTATPEVDAYQFGKRPELLFEQTPSNAQARAIPASSTTHTPETRSRSHWTVGSFEGQAPSWADKRLESDRAAYEDVGFRCALDGETVNALMLDAEFVEK